MRKIIIGIIIGMLISSGAYAAVSISSDKVGYKDTTVKESLDNLFDESVSGKNSIIAALSNKGFNVTNDSTYSEIVNGINELPVTIAKDEDGNMGYFLEENSSFIPFDDSSDFNTFNLLFYSDWSVLNTSGAGTVSGQTTDGLYITVSNPSKAITSIITGNITLPTNCSVAFEYYRNSEYYPDPSIFYISVDNGTTWTALDNFRSNGLRTISLDSYKGQNVKLRLESYGGGAIAVSVQYLTMQLKKIN